MFPKPRLLAAAALAGGLACLVQAAESDAALVRRGARLAAYGGCADCHTPSRMGPQGPEKDVARGLSGHPANLALPPPPPAAGAWTWAGSASMTAFAGPWGTSYAANLTPDRGTGIGNWRERDFILAMRRGRHLGAGRPILPPMPWQSIGSLSDRDLAALFRYLQAQPAVKNRVPEPVPPPPAAHAAVNGENAR